MQSTGQLGSNIKDPSAMLREVTQSVSDLIGLVESSADDLGVDLQDKPDEYDEEQFEKTSVEEEPSKSEHRSESSTSFSCSNSAEIRMARPEEQPSEDQRINETHRELTELSEARSQLVDELDAISEDIQAKLQDRRVSEQGLESFENILSRASTQDHRRLRNKSIDSVIDKIPQIREDQSGLSMLSCVLSAPA